MQRMLYTLALLMSVILLFNAMLCTTPEAISALAPKAEAAVLADLEQGANSYTASGYTTYTMADASLKWNVKDYTEGGINTTAMQGMNTGMVYCYVAKHGANDAYTDLIRINMNTGAVTEMDFYASTTATATSACNTLKHANELSVVGIDGYNYLYASTCNRAIGIARHKIDGTKFMFTGYFKVVTPTGGDLATNAIRHIKTVDGCLYFMLVAGPTFYVCRIPATASGGTESNPTIVTAYKMFRADCKNIVVATSNTAYKTVDAESWTFQGAGYNITEGVAYLPIWAGSVSQNTTVIATYNVKNNINSWFETTENLNNVVYPTRTSFYIQNTAVSFFEIESCSFRNGTGYNGDNKLYFNTNGGTAATEGVYAVNYTTGSGDFTPLNEGTTTYTVVYNANGGTGTTKSTRHIRGIAAKLGANGFTRNGYTFAGWYLTRKGDGKWLYRDTNGTANWYDKGSQPKGSYLALYSDEQTVSMLTHYANDTVTCYAQWTPVSTGTATYYIQYDSNGGTGYMSDTAVVVGTGTAISTNTFVREGYTFVGWTCHRRSDNTWFYKNPSTGGDATYKAGSVPDGYYLKTYYQNAVVARTSSTDMDIVTMYAVWANVENSLFPSTVAQGSALLPMGTVKTTTDIYGVTVGIKDSDGTVLSSYSANPYTDSFDLTAATLDFATLAVGEYLYEIKIQTHDNGKPQEHILQSTAFSVVPAKLTLTDAAASKGLYQLGESLTGVALQSTATTVVAQFKNTDVRVSDHYGQLLDQNAIVGTGCFVGSYINNELSDGVFITIKGDVDGNGYISASDYMFVISDLIGTIQLTGCYRTASDIDENGELSSADYLAISLRLMGINDNW